MAKKDVVENTDVVENVEDVKVEDAKVEEAKVEVPKQDIIRGRMPLPIVAMIKFGSAEMTDGAVAAKFRTTNGKVSDIRKDRNFGYIKDSYVPSAEMLEKAKAYAGQLDDKSVLEKVEGMTPATEEQNAAFDAERKASRPAKVAKEAAPVETEPEVTDEELESLSE